MNAVYAMSKNPDAVGVSVYDVLASEEPQDQRDAEVSPAEEAAILRDHRHPRWQEMRERYEARLFANEVEEV